MRTTKWAVVIVETQDGRAVGIMETDDLDEAYIVNGWQFQHQSSAYIASRVYAAQCGLPMYDGSDAFATPVRAESATGA